MAGGIINDVLSTIQALAPNSLYWLDLDNTVNTTADQAYVDTTDTDILEIISVYQRETDTKLKRINRETYVRVFPDTTQHTGIPDMAYDVEQALNVSGQNIHRIYLIPTPSSAIALRYDYRKNARFASDGTGANAAFCPLPMQFDPLIQAMFNPRFLQVLDRSNNSAISKAEETESIALSRFLPMLNQQSDEIISLGSYRQQQPYRFQNVADTPAPWS